MKNCVIALLSALAIPASATVTVTFNNPFTPPDGGVSEGFADADSNVQNGLVYGIVIDTSSNGFLLGYDSGFNLSQGSLITLSNAGLDTDDRLFVSAGLNASDTNAWLTSDTSGLQEGDFSTTGGTGGIIGMSDIPGSVATLPFAVIWFDDVQAVDTTVQNGTQFGLLEDASFVLPSDGNSDTYDDPFKGVDPVRPSDDGVFVIPEPSSLLLLGLGAVGFLRRRR